MILKQYFLMFVCINFATFVAAEKTVCYFQSWATYRPCYGAFDVENIDPFLCTDLVYAFAKLNNQTWQIEAADPYNDLCADQDPQGQNCAYDRFVALKEQNSDLTVSLAVGGNSESSPAFSQMSADPTRREIFVNSTVALLVAHKFDGLVLYWRWPASYGGVPSDRESFVLLTRDLRTAFDSFDPPLELSTVMSGWKYTIDEAYDVIGLDRTVDFFHLFSFDYHGFWENTTHHHAPLCGYANDTGGDIYLRVDYAVSYFLDLGASAEKIIMGIALYGRCWTVDDYNNKGMRAAAHSTSPPGQYVGLSGYYGYNEICERLLSHNGEVVHDENLKEPYFYTTDSVWCGYDDADSAYTKARFAKNKGIAGVLVWSIDQGDFRPVCSPEKNIHLTYINNALLEAADEDPDWCPELGWTSPQINVN